MKRSSRHCNSAVRTGSIPKGNCSQYFIQTNTWHYIYNILYKPPSQMNIKLQCPRSPFQQEVFHCQWIDRYQTIPISIFWSSFYLYVESWRLHFSSVTEVFFSTENMWLWADHFEDMLPNRVAKCEELLVPWGFSQIKTVAIPQQAFLYVDMGRSSL